MKNLFYFLRVLLRQPLMVGCTVALLSSLSLQAQTDWNQVIKTASSTRAVKSPDAGAATDFFGYAVAVDGNYAVLGAYQEDEDAAGGNRLNDAGSVIVFEKIGGTWTQIKKLVASDRAAFAWFGYSVAISGTTVVVGANLESNNDEGAAYVFSKDQGGSNNWGQVKKLVASDRAAGDAFGYSVAISGTTVVVGANQEDEDAAGANTLNFAGSAYIFSRDQGGSNNWGQVKKLVASDRATSDRFGNSVAISGTTVVVGAAVEDEDAAGANTLNAAGSVYVFSQDQGGDNNWGQVKKLVASDRVGGERFGISVAISGTTVVVGAYLKDLGNPGAAYVFNQDEGGSNAWGQVKKLVASDRAMGDNFGISVAIAGTTVVVGAYAENEDAAGANTLNAAGSAYVFSKDQGGGNNWGQVKKLVASDRATNDQFGYSVAISGTTVVVGAHLKDKDAAGANTVEAAGSAYLFSQDQGGSNNWGQSQKIVLEDFFPGQHYGYSVAIDGNYAVVGAYGDCTDATGGVGLLQAGAAYILQKNGGVWQQVKKIVASDRAEGDLFGFSVAISGTTVVVGAYIEGEGASLSEQGAAYVFSKDQGGTDNWGEVKKIVASNRAGADNFGCSVAISGTTVVVGAFREDEDAAEANTVVNAGSAYVFSKDQGGANNWGQVKKLVASDRATFDSFGISVAISGTTVVVGAYAEDEDATGMNTVVNAGSAYVFSQDQGGSNNWGQVKKLVASDRGADDYFGKSVAISGTTVVVGSHLDDKDAAGVNLLASAGSAYVFSKDQGGVDNWGQVKKLVSSVRKTNNQLGFSVAISGTTVVVGGNGEADDASGANPLTAAGAAYVFSKDQGGSNNWGQVKKLVASDRGADDQFGISVAISGTALVVGAYREDEDAAGSNTFVDTGSAYFFEGTTTSPDYTITTTGNVLTITDVSGNGETLDISQNGSNIRFNVTGRTYSLNGGLTTPFTTSAEVALAGLTSIVVNTAAGNDVINVGEFTANLPTLTINGGVGDDQVNFNGNITFAANANLDLDLQNDDVNPGVDAVRVALNANVKLTDTGAATVKVSKNVQIFAGGSLETVNGNLLVEANQQATPTSGTFNGVNVSGSSGFIRSTGSGSVTVKGQGGDNSGGSQFGVQLNGGGQIYGNTVNVVGNGGTSDGNSNHGVYINGANSLISSTGGNVSVTGTGGGKNASSANRGVYLINNSRITAGGTGNVTVVGNGGASISGSDNNGVVVSTTCMITSSGGGVSVTAKEGGGSNSIGMSLSGSGEAISTATNGGNIILIANSMAILSPVSTNLSSTFRLQPLTSGTQINLGSSSDPMGGPLSLSNSELGSIRTGTLIIGDATAGAISVSAGMTYPVYTPPTNVQLISGSDINVSGGGFNTGGGTLLLDPGSSSAAIKPTFNGTDVAASTLTLGGDLNITINGTTAGDGTGSTYSQLKVVGGVNLSGANLVLSGTTTLVGGETFVIVDNDGTEAVGGTFSNFAQGATLSNFLGSGRSATISYTGGTDNNDVVITVEAPAAPNINIKGNGFTIINGDTSPRTQDGTDFGNVDIYSTDPVVRTFTIENTGTVDLVIPANGITKSGAGDFGIGTVLLPLTIAPGSSATFPVIIDASGNGRRTATISIQSNDPDASPYTFDVTAVGVSPEINVTGLGQDILSGDTTPSTLDDTDFGSVDVNSGVVSHTFTIQNTGGTGGDLYINAGAITISGTHANDFSISGITLPVTVSPGQSVTFVVNFNPAAIGTRTATIRIANNDLGESQYRFDVQGTGITADYTITTTGNNLIITDVTGTGETLDISQNSSNIRFDVTGKTFSLNNGLATNFPADVALSGITSIVVNTAAGNDIINVGTFTTQLPTLTINGGTGDDEVAFEGSINFASNASLDLDMQNDDTNPGIDQVSFNSGNVILSGTGTATLKVSKSVFVVAGASVQTSDGNLTIESNQQATPTAASFSGVNVTGTILVNGTGNLLIKGKGGNLTNSSQDGVVVSTGGLIQGGATGTTTIIGTGGASSGSFNRGVVVIRANSKITSSGGNVSVTGQGGGRATAAENDGILVFDGSQISAGGTGTVTVIGTGGQNSTGSSNFGVSVRGTNAQIFSNNGHVSVTGNGGGQTSGSSISNDGIVLATDTKIRAGGSGNLFITGTGGSTSGNGNDGVVLSGELSTTGGNITILATGNATPGSSSGTHTGMSILTGGLVNAGGTGTISLTGNGGSSAGLNNLGIYMTGGAVSTSNGNIHLIANGKGTEGNNKGLDIISGTITAGGQGNLLIEGQGSLTAINSGNMGVEISGTNSTVATNNGNITITGLGGGSDEQGSNIGIYVHNSGKINAGGSGNVILNGSGGASNGESNVGVNVGNNGVINTQGGNITITGIEGNGTFNYGINLQPGATISTASNGGNIRFNTNSFYAGEDEVSNKTISTNASGTITIQPRTSNTAINLGEITDPTTAGSSLNLNDFELDYMTTGTLIIGDAMSGNITVSQPITRPASTNVQLISGGDVIISGGSMNTNGGTLLLDPGTSPKAVKPTFNGTDVIASTLSFNSDLEITINGTTLGNGTGSTYSQLNVEGAINLTGVDLLLAGTYMPIGGEIFTIVNNDGTDAITGTFNGLAEGATMPNFRGSNLSATISYTGGTGNNDVVITVGQICPTVSNAGPDQTPACGTTQVTLAGNTPTVGTGVWSVVSGTGGTFGNANSATSTFTGVAGNSYVLRWTISNGQCTASTDDVDVTFTQTPTVSNAGPNQTPTCGTTQVTLAGNTPSVGTGVWSVVSGTGGTFGNANSATSTFTGVAGNSYVLRWTISNGQCSASTDDVDVTFTQNLAPPTIGTITQPTCTLPTGSVVLNGLPSSGTWILTRNPGSVTSMGTGVTTTVSGLVSGTYTFTVTNASGCTSGVSGDVDITLPPSNISITTGTSLPICAGATSFTIPYTATTGSPTSYSITGAGITSVTNGLLTSTPIVVNLSGPATGSSITYSLVVSNASGCVSPNVTGSVAVVGPPTISLTTLQQTLNEGNNPVLCDTDANPVNGLQFNVSGSCVVGNPVWRVQVGNSAWSNWSANAPVSQPSNNQLYRYQAACDANCASTYSGVIELTINNRASVPQNVSLMVDGVTVAVGETKEVCSLVNMPLTFNANCSTGEVVLYSVDGGEYSAGVPVGLVDNQFHNYRVRCRKSDGTPSCVESESGVMRLKLVTIPSAPRVSLSSTTSCDATASFSGQSTCGSLRTVWYNATTNVALPNLPSTVPSQTTSYYARCQTENGCVSEKSNVVTFTLTPTQVAPVITASQEIVCTGTTVTISANCPAGSQTFWNTGVTAPSFEVAFNNVTKQTYWAKCIFEGGCQSAESMKKDIYWNAFVVTLINIGESKSAVKPANDKSLWTSQFITRDGGPELEQSTQVNPTLFYVENANKMAPRYWTINVEACGLSTDGSLTFDMLATPEMGVIRSFNTHENNAPYFMYANREGWTELYAQNHPAYGFYQDNGAGGNVYDTGLPKGLYKLGIRYWDQKGWGSIYPSTRKPQGNVLAYQEYWFRIQSRDGVGVGAARSAEQVASGQMARGEGQESNGKEQGSDNGKQITDNGTFATVLPNPITNILRLKVQNSKGQVVQTSLTDASGREVLRRQFVPETNTHQEEFGVSELPTGMYFLKVTTETQQATLKVVKAP